jgi:hypothetical protein
MKITSRRESGLPEFLAGIELGNGSQTEDDPSGYQKISQGGVDHIDPIDREYNAEERPDDSASRIDAACLMVGCFAPLKDRVDGLDFALATSFTGDTVSDDHGTILTDALAAALADADGIGILMIETFHIWNTFLFSAILLNDASYLLIPNFLR